MEQDADFRIMRIFLYGEKTTVRICEESSKAEDRELGIGDWGLDFFFP